MTELPTTSFFSPRPAPPQCVHFPSSWAVCVCVCVCARVHARACVRRGEAQRKGPYVGGCRQGSPKVIGALNPKANSLAWGAVSLPAPLDSAHLLCPGLSPPHGALVSQLPRERLARNCVRLAQRGRGRGSPSWVGVEGTGSEARGPPPCRAARSRVRSWARTPAPPPALTRDPAPRRMPGTSGSPRGWSCVSPAPPAAL